MMSAETQQTLSGFYQAFADALRARIRFILRGTPEEAEDVLQEVFVKACWKWESLASHSHPYGWLYRVATTTAIDAARHHQRFSAPCLPLPDEDRHPLSLHAQDPQDTCVLQETIAEALAALSPVERRLRLHESVYGEDGPLCQGCAEPLPYTKTRGNHVHYCPACKRARRRALERRQRVRRRQKGGEMR